MNGRLPLLHVVHGFSCLVCCLNMSADTLDSSDDSHLTQTRAKRSKVWDHYEQNPLVMYVFTVKVFLHSYKLDAFNWIHGPYLASCMTRSWCKGN
jgi:hypothetical protein